MTVHRLSHAARSFNEVHFYIELHACERCGSREATSHTDWYRTEWPMDGSGMMEWRSSGRYDVTCSRCGDVRSLEFFTAPGFQANYTSFHLGGSRPSEIIEPHEFVAELFRIDSELAPDLLQTPLETREPSGMLVLRAQQCGNELAKFFPEGASQIPAECFRTEAAKAARASHPEHFTREFVRRYELHYDAISAELQAQVDARVAVDPHFTTLAAPVSRPPLSDASIKLHERWLSDKGGERLEARGVGATGRRLSALDLTGSILDDVVLDRADLSFTRFDGARLTNVRARGADFGSAILAGTSVERCQFTVAAMPIANLGDASIEDTDFAGAVLERTTWYRSKVTRCSFAACNLSDSGIDNAVFVDCDFREADLGLVRGLLGTSMHAEFHRCDLRDTNWLDRDLFRVKFVDCKLAGARGIPIISETVFERPDLSPAGDGSKVGTDRDVLVQWGIDPDNIRASITKLTTYSFTAGERARLDDEIRRLGTAILRETRYTDKTGEQVSVSVREPMDAPFRARFDELLETYRKSLLPPPTERDVHHRKLAQQIIDGSIDRGESFEQTIHAVMLAGFTRSEALEAMTRATGADEELS